jgi:type II secretory pathway pseudopilin PulG
VELLVVIAIIGILAAMLMPVFSVVKTRALVAKSRTEIEGIVNAVNAYDTDYGRFPMTKVQQKYAGVNDYTTGYLPDPQANIAWPPPATAWDGSHYFSLDNNSNTIAMLMDLTSFGNGVLTSNTNHVENPKQVKYLTAKEVTDPTQPGVGPDGVYRDPWGNPYVITMNSSYNEQGCRDIFYSQAKVSQQSGQTGYEGLFNPNASNPGSDNFLYHGKVMVWSAGPDKKVRSDVAANQDVNKDNITSW